MIEFVIETCLDATYWVLDRRYGQLIACLVLLGGLALIALLVVLLWWNL